MPSEKGMDTLKNNRRILVFLNMNPSVKRITGDFLRVGLIRFKRPKLIIAEAFDKDGIHGTNKHAGIGETGGDRLIIPGSVLHADFRLAIQLFDNPDQG